MNTRILLVLVALTACIALTLSAGCGTRPKPKIDWTLLHQRFSPETLAVPPGTKFTGWMDMGIGGGSDPSQHGTVGFLLNIQGLVTADMVNPKLTYAHEANEMEITNLQDDVIRYYIGVLNECGVDVNWSNQESIGGLGGRFRRLKGTSADAVFSTNIEPNYGLKGEMSVGDERLFHMVVRLSIIPH